MPAPLTENQIAEIREHLHNGEKVTQISRDTGYSENSVRGIMRLDEGNNRAILLTIADHPGLSAEELAILLGMPAHDVKHILRNSLTNFVRFVESRQNGRVNSDLLRVQLGRAGYRALGINRRPGTVQTERTEPEVAHSHPEPDDITLTVEAEVPEPEEPAVQFPAIPAPVISHVEPRWPILEQLRSRVHHVERAIQHLDDAGLTELALTLIDRTNLFSELEREYLRFAAHHYNEDTDVRSRDTEPGSDRA